jgi:outer membrane protein TolC
MASDLERLVTDLCSYLEEAVKGASGEGEGAKKPKNPVRPHDLNKLKMALDDLQQKKLMATQGRQTAEKAVLWMTGSSFQSIENQELEPISFEKKKLDEYLNLARLHRPEFKALAAGQTARNSLADAKQAQSYPTFFVGGYFSAAWSPVRDKQNSFYALDSFNRIEGGAGVGLRLDLEFARHAAEAAEERAQSLKLKATESYAVPGIELQVKKAYWEVEQAIEGLEIALRRKKLGKKWFISSTMGWSIGVTAPKDLLEALEGNGQAKKNYIETVYAHNLAIAKLSQAVGVEVTDLKY